MGPSYAEVVGHDQNDLVEMVTVQPKCGLKTGIGDRTAHCRAAKIYHYVACLPPGTSDSLNDRVRGANCMLGFDWNAERRSDHIRCLEVESVTPPDGPNIETTST